MFNVGDRVQIVNVLSAMRVGVIREIDNGSPMPYQVFVEGDSDGKAGALTKLLFGTVTFPFSEDELMLFVEGEPKFAVGDRVSIDPSRAGPATGTVHEVKASPNSYEVWVDGDSDGEIGDILQERFGRRTVTFKEYSLEAI